MKKVLHISKYYYPFIGGIEQTARDIVKVLREDDNYVQKVICFNENACIGELICYAKEDTCDLIDGIEVVRCGVNAKYASQAISMTYNRNLRKVMDEFQPDIVILHYPNPFVTHFLLQYRNRNFKLITYWHLDITRQKVLGKFFYRQNHRLLKRSDAIVATSPNYVKGSMFLSAYEEKVFVIPSCINEERLIVTEEIENKAAKIRERYQGKVLCFSVGRHVPYKGFSYLIKASEEVSEDLHFVIGGTGELTEELKKEAAGNTKITFVGKIPDDDLIAYYLACDILCFPSITKNEAFGLALAEGMYFGKPAVTFTIPGSGVNYVNLDGVTGIECQSKSCKAYATALNTLAESKEARERYGNDAHRRVVDNFTFAFFSRKVLELMKNKKVCGET